MKRFTILLSLILVVFISCQEENEITIHETGTVVDYAGAGECGFVIELDNGSRILPMYYPKGFTFAHGQRILVEYVELNNVTTGCDRGVVSEIIYVEELSCAPYVDLYFSNYDSLARDPVYLHEAMVDGDCLYLKISYSGGCQEHTVDLARMHPWCGTPPLPPATFEIRHNANGDLCEAYFTREFRFDLTPLIQEGKKEFILTAKLVGGNTYNKTFNLN
ncbi:MAG: NigD-like N-terminal domain-containing protein [Bacteroidota bacterium]